MTDLVIPAPLWRRLAALGYDALLMFAAAMLVELVLVIATDATGAGVPQWATRALCFAIGALYFGASWTRGGQTLGMKAWRLLLRRDDGSTVAWPTALLRYATAWVSLLAFGLGFAWALVDGRRRALHDLLAGTEMVVLPR